MKPRLLFLCHTLPYPPDGGVWIRTYNVFRLLAAEFDVTALCFERARALDATSPHDPAASLKFLRQFADVELFEIPQMRSRVRWIRDHVRSLVAGRVFTYYRYDNERFRSRLGQLLRERRFSLIHVDSLDLVRYLGMLRGTPVVCVHHNVESQLLRRRAHAEPSPITRRYISHQARLMERAERKWCPRVDLNVCVSAEDANWFRGLAPGGQYEVVSNGVDTEYYHPEDRPKHNDLIFVGGSSWFPNRDALDHFCSEILPLLRQRRPDLRVRWVGDARSGDQGRYWKEASVELTGYVEDVRPHVWDSHCFVVPLRVGGGSRLKILDAWAMGKPVVSTSVGCEGLHAVDGENILIRDSPSEFADAVLSVLGDHDLARRLGDSARVTVQREYSWPRIGELMSPLYHDLSRRHGGELAAEEPRRR